MHVKSSQPIKLVSPVTLKRLSDSIITRQFDAAKQCVSAARAISKKSHSPVSALLHSERRPATISQEHIPSGDVFDDENGYQFYVHSHRNPAHELAHIHVFFHATATGRRRTARSWGKQSPSHLMAISFDSNGWPKGLFIPNLWVTDGFWLSSQSIMQRIEAMDLTNVPIKHRLVARFIQGLLQMCTPDIQALLTKRDALIKKASDQCDLTSVLANERWEVLCHLDFDLPTLISRVEEVCEARGIT